MDIFSAASTLVFAAKGRSPFSAKSNSEWMEAIGNRAPDLSDLTPNQIRYLNPLFVKNKSDRPDANQAKLSAEQFIELINRNVKDIQPTNWPYFEDLRQLAGQIPDINSDLYVNVNSSFSKRFLKLFPKKFVVKFILLAVTSILLFVGVFKYINMDKPGPYGVFDEKSTLGFDESNLKPATLELRLKCENLIAEKKFKEAYSFCESASLQGDAVSMFDLVTVITELDESPDFTEKNRQSILQNLTKSYDLGFSDAGFSLAYFKAIFNPNEIEEAIKIYNLSWKKNPALGSFEGLGYLNYKVGNLVEAEKLFIKEIQLDDPDTIFTAYESLGILYYEQKRWTDSKKYLQLASSGGKNAARYYLAEILRLIDNNLSEACNLYESISDLNEDANLANTKYCEGLRFSFPVSQNVLVGSLFGRPYLGDDLFWRIPLSLGGEDLIDFSGIQFRDSSGKIEWSNIPFKIEKSDIQTNALVDSFFFVTLFSKDFCPEFRVVLEDSAEVKKIWSKSNSLCAN
jgi:tetratricopeptide (TPR) repeat protein